MNTLKFHSLLALLLSAALLTGCATGPQYAGVERTLTPIPPGCGRVFFYRPSIIGYAVMPVIGVNGKPICKSKAQGCFYADCPAGPCDIAAFQGSFVNSPGQRGTVLFTPMQTPTPIKIMVNPGEPRYIRLTMDDTFFYIMDKAVGEREMRQCKLQTAYTK